MGTFSYEEVFGWDSCQEAFSHVQEWPILPESDMVISLRSIGEVVRRVASIWKIMMNPHNIDMEDISNVFWTLSQGCWTWGVSHLKRLYLNLQMRSNASIDFSWRCHHFYEIKREGSGRDMVVGEFDGRCCQWPFQCWLLWAYDKCSCRCWTSCPQPTNVGLHQHQHPPSQHVASIDVVSVNCNMLLASFEQLSSESIAATFKVPLCIYVGGIHNYIMDEVLWSLPLVKLLAWLN